MNQQAKYIHALEHHNLDAPREIVPFIMEKFYPQSVVDVGCGNGTFLHVFFESGVKDILGVDGSWVDRSTLFFPEPFFLEKDLEKDLNINRKFDLVLCLEVAEHLSEDVASNFVSNLTNLGNIIIFSAAINNQGGQNHINEQHFHYWIDKFDKRGFLFYDIFRRNFWNNKKVSWWYKQNMFLVAHHSIDVSKFGIDTGTSQKIFEYVHPELLESHSREIQKFKNKVNWIKDGKAPAKFYLQLLKKKIALKFSKQSPGKTF
jgi:SAM-dependent methyltransferase